MSSHAHVDGAKCNLLNRQYLQILTTLEKYLKLSEVLVNSTWDYSIQTIKYNIKVVAPYILKNNLL